MSCVEKRHMSHRGVGSMLHHRFPNGFTDLSMDDTDREVSTLTDRAFRSLCVGDDAVYNDELLYGYSPFSCHKPLAAEPPKKTQQKESKKTAQTKMDKKTTPGQQKNISHMSSFLKAFGASEGSCEGLLIKNGDSNGESWDKSALRSIQRELSEFSSDYHTSLTGGHNKNHQHFGDGSSNKVGRDVLPSGKSSKLKNGKSTVKLRKLIIKNFFLHSEFSPFQTWRDFNQFPFGQKDTVTPLVPADNVPKWYDLPFYKELTEAHRKETLHSEENQSQQKAAVEHPPTTAPKPVPPPSPPKLLPKPLVAIAEKRCSSDRSEGAAPWRRNRSRANSAIPANQTATLSQDTCLAAVNESLLLLKKEARSVEVKAVEEVNSLASTPFSICQLMTPLIPSRQPTETSEILQTVLSPSVLDHPLRPHSEVKLTPEPPVKRDSYKSLASSILFNLKDNRKRVKSRYSPPKFKTLEVPEGSATSPESDQLKHPQTGSDCNDSGLSSPPALKDVQTVCSPLVQSPPADLTKYDPDQSPADDYLISNLLQTKREAAGTGSEENPISPLMHPKKNKSPAKKQNYPSLNLYKKANNADNDMKYLQVPLSPEMSLHTDQPAENNELSSLAMKKEYSPTNTGLSPNTLNFNKDLSPIISPHALEKGGISPNVSAGKRPPNVPDKPKRPVKDIQDKDCGTQPANSKEKDSSQSNRTKDVIRAAREAINAAKKSINKSNSDIEALRDKEIDEKIGYSKENTSSRWKSSSENQNVSSQSGNEASGERKKAPPPVPKRNLTKSEIQLALDKQHTHEKLTNGDLGEAKDGESVQKKSKLKHIFSARQNNYIKCQRFAVTDDEQRDECEEGDLKDEVRDSEHLINDLHALKELERARLGDHIQENTKNKFGVVNLDEETRAKNDMISRELRNIKKGMMSMRGNTTAKRDIFAKKEKEQIKPETFKKIDSNVIVNKALINDNYDKAKLALEEIISERQIRKNKMTEKDANPTCEENAGDESCLTRTQQRKTARRESLTESREKEKDIKERLGDLRDHSHIRQILSQTEPIESHRSGGRTALPATVGKEPKTPRSNKTKYVTDKQFDNPSNVADNTGVGRHTVRHMSEDTGEDLMTEEMKLNNRSAPPKSRKESNKRDGSINMDADSLEDGVVEDVFNKHGMHENFESHLAKEIRHSGSEKADVDLGLFIKDTLPNSCNKEKQDVGNSNLESITATDAVTCDNVIPSKYQPRENILCFSPEFRGNENKTNNLQTEPTLTLDNNSEAQQTCRVKRKASLKTENLTTPDVTKTLVSEEQSGRMNTAGAEVNVDAEILCETSRTITSPLLLVNGLSITQSPPDHSSLSSKSSYFSVESALHRNADSNVYQSLENLIGEVEEHGELEEHHSTRNSKQDSDRTEGEYYSLSDHDSEPELKHPIKVPQREKEVLYKEEKGKDGLNHDDNNQTSSNIFSPTLGIPALFKVKDNTFSNKARKTLQPWSPRGSLIGSERVEAELNQGKENTEIMLDNTSKVKTVQPWSPRGTLNCSEREEEGIHQGKENPEIPLDNISKVKTAQPWSPRGILIDSERGEEELHRGNENPETLLDNTSKVKMVQPWSPRRILNCSEREGEELHQGKENIEIPLDNISKVENVQPWSPRGILIGSERGEEELHQEKEHPEMLLDNTSKVKMVQPWSPRRIMNCSERGEEELNQGSEHPEMLLDNTSKVKIVQPWSPRRILNCSDREEELHQGKENPEIPLDNISKVKILQPWSQRGSLIGAERVEPELHQGKENSEIPLDNTTKVTVQSWSPRGVLIGSETVEVQLCQSKETSEISLANETATSNSTSGVKEILKSQEVLSHHSTPLMLSPSSVQSNNSNQTGGFLPVPQEEDQFPGVSPLSEGGENPLATIAANLRVNADRPAEGEVSRVPSERSGSTCSGNDSQTGVPKPPPTILPKSEKAVLKAMKLTNRRIKKEEKNKKSELKSSRSGKSSEKKHREKVEDSHHDKDSHHSKNRISHNTENHHHNRTETSPNTRKQIHDSVENNQNNEPLHRVSAERQGRGSDRRNRDKHEQRHYSSDRVISNVPVYKANVNDRPMSDRTFQRSQSTDRYFGDKAERRFSADMSINEKLDLRSQRIEKSIMDELQQRGRVRDRPSRDRPSKDNSQRRSHSIDTYTPEVPPPSGLSRQSSHTSHTSHTSQLSRQSSVEHAIVTQSIPMTQRKLLQDPESGQFFFVDMPVQVKTKTFFDPETGTYVQLPVQPPEGAVLKPSPMEVLTPPLVVYHSFVPVPLSPMAQKASIQTPQMEPEEFELRKVERSKPMHCQDGRPYLEPVCGQHDHMLGEFLGTEELDCPG